MQRYLLGIQYIGTKYSGWPPLNVRGEFNSVHYVLEDALRDLVGIDNVNNLYVSSRTDGGVHALRNVFTVDLVRKRRQNLEILEPFVNFLWNFNVD